MSTGFRWTMILLLFIAVEIPVFYYRQETKVLNFEREQQVKYLQGALDFYYPRYLKGDQYDVLSVMFWAGKMIHEIEVLKEPIVPHYDATAAIGQFYFD